MVPCLSCEQVYIGETIKSLKTRLNQHKYAIRTFNKANSIFRHVSELGHEINWTASKFVFNSKDKQILQLVESSFIHFVPNFNLTSGFYTLAQDLYRTIFKHFKNMEFVAGLEVLAV